MAAFSNDLIGPPELQTQLQGFSDVIRCKKGTVLFRRGDGVRGVFIVLQGRVILSLETGNPLYPARVLGPGSIIGLPATMAGAPYSLTAEVAEDAKLAFVTREAMMDCLRHHPDLCFHVMDLLSNEISAIRDALKRVDLAHSGRAS